MKAQILGMLALSMALAACSGGGSSAGNSGAGFSTDLQPQSVPQNAVSDVNLKRFGQLMGKATATIPDDAAFMKSALSGTDISSVSDEDRKNALKVLSQQGQSVLKSIKGKCQIQEPRVTSNQDVSVPYAGATSSKTAASSVGGQGCPINEKIESSMDIKYTRVDNDGKKVIVEANSSNTYMKALTTSEELARLSGVSSQSMRIKYSGNAVVNKTATQSTQDMHFNVSGSGRMTFVNGEKADVRIQGEIVSSAGITNTQIAFEFRISTGVFRLVVVKSGSTQTIYLNGQTITSEQLAQILPGATINFK